MLLRLCTLLLLVVAATAIDAEAFQYSYSQPGIPQPTPPSNEKPTTPKQPGQHAPPLIDPHSPVMTFPTRNNTGGTLPPCKNIQAPGVRGNLERAEAVREAFLYAWNSYSKYAFGFDELRPLTANGTNSRYGWGLTIVDSLDTAIIMGYTEVVQQMLEFISTIDFTTTESDDSVSLFEATIRYVGGLLSAYDLLKSGQFPNRYEQVLVENLLAQAVRLTNKLAYGFNTPTGIHTPAVNWTTNTPIFTTYTAQATNQTYNSTNSAEIGTLLLEFTRLSDLTGNQTYRELVERSNSYLIHPHPPPIYPGLIGTQFDTDTGRMLNLNGGWQAGVDSFFEYLIKAYQYHSTPTTRQYRDFWLQAVDSTIDHLALHPFGFPDLTLISRLTTNGSIEQFADEFSCFAGGNWLLGGALLDQPPVSALGAAWVDGCHQTFNTSATGLGPLAWAWYDEQGAAFDPADDNDAAARRSAARRGFWVPDGLENWFTRPEPIESLFYAHRITGDARWSEYAWEVFQAINDTSRNAIAFAAVNNVDIWGGGTMSDNLDSFFFAEVLKYLYLSFTDSDVVDLSQWVFNTEAHPLRVQCSTRATGTSPGATTHTV